MTRKKCSAFVQSVSVVAGMLGVSASAMAADGSSWGGFVDAGFSLSGSATQDQTGVRDGALYFSNTSGSSMFMFDMPFSLRQGSNDMWLGKNKAQAFVKHSYSGGMGWRFGQFDGIFGLERNDTKDLMFVTQGAVYTYTQPKTHMALEASTAMAGMDIQVYVGGTNGQGGTMTNDRPEVGAKVSMGSFAVGGNYRKTGEDQSLMYLNAMGSMKFAGVDLGVEGAYTKAGEGDASIAAGATGTYGLTSDMDAGIRAQYVTKVAGDVVSFDKKMELTAGIRQKMSSNLFVKANYVYDSTTAVVDGDAAVDHSAHVAAVMSF